jgi:biopolymer transport protein ExbB/TolQ
MNEMLVTVIRFFQDGGPFMYPILIVLAIGLAITVERWLHLTVAKTKNRHMIAKLMPLVAKGEVNSASQLASKSSATVSRILLQGIEHYKSARRRDDFESAMDESIMEAIPRLEKRTHYLAMFANIATLLGLLGTIIGLIKAFDESGDSFDQYIGSDEYNRIWTHRRNPAVVLLHGVTNQDDRNRRQSRDDCSQVRQSFVSR